MDTAKPEVKVSSLALRIEQIKLKRTIKLAQERLAEIDGIKGKSRFSFKLPKLSPSEMISISIIVIGLLLCGTYYIANKDNGRYEYQRGLIIDKKTGEARRITVKE